MRMLATLWTAPEALYSQEKPIALKRFEEVRNRKEMAQKAAENRKIIRPLTTLLELLG